MICELMYVIQALDRAQKELERYAEDGISDDGLRAISKCLSSLYVHLYRRNVTVDDSKATEARLHIEKIRNLIYKTFEGEHQ